MKANWTLTSAMVLILGGTAAFGQSNGIESSGFWEGHGYRAGARSVPYGGDGYGGFGGTYEGSVLHGLGAYARGMGEYNYYSALAAAEAEQARNQLIENQRLAVENWHSLRKAHQDRRKAEWEAEKLTAAEVARIVESKRPARLTPAQYEPATGKLTWPAALLSEEFAADRASLEEAFTRRTATDAGADSEFFDLVRELTERMLAKLRKKNPELSPLQYIASKKFLVGLKYESISPFDSKALAARE